MSDGSTGPRYKWYVILVSGPLVAFVSERISMGVEGEVKCLGLMVADINDASE